MAKEALEGDGLLIGPELVINGGFDTDTIWDKGPGWTITGGVGVATAVSNGVNLRQTIATVSGTRYMHRFDIVSLSSGTITPKVGGVSGTVRNTIATFTEIITAGASTTTNGVGSSLTTTTGSVDNISIRELFS